MAEHGTTTQASSISTAPSAAIRNISYGIAAITIFLGFLAGAGSTTGQRIFCGAVVGLIGIAAFVRHNVTAKSDAARIGFPLGGFQYEVGFANLASGLVGVIAALVNWGAGARVAVIFGFGLYLLQVFLLHLRQAMTGQTAWPKAASILIPTAGLVLVLLIAAALGAREASLWPFCGGMRSCHAVRNARARSQVWRWPNLSDLAVSAAEMRLTVRAPLLSTMPGSPAFLG